MKIGDKATGKVLKFVEDRGFGFLSNDSDVRVMVFFHITRWLHVSVIPQEGQRVSYEFVKGNPGKDLQAGNVRLIDASVEVVKSLAEIAAETAKKVLNPADLLAQKNIPEVK